MRQFCSELWGQVGPVSRLFLLKELVKKSCALLGTPYYAQLADEVPSSNVLAKTFFECIEEEARAVGLNAKGAARDAQTDAFILSIQDNLYDWSNVKTLFTVVEKANKKKKILG
jgi:hypothetical protein